MARTTKPKFRELLARIEARTAKMSEHRRRQGLCVSCASPLLSTGKCPHGWYDGGAPPRGRHTHQIQQLPATDEVE